MLFTRRTFIGSATTAGLAIASSGAHAADACTVFTKELQSATSPQAAIDLLREGNSRFVSGNTINCDLRAQVKSTASGQNPFAVVIGCIDSRVPPELVFDQRLGAIFCARVAGNFVNRDILGSVEYACKVAGSRAVVVLGHSECGAIKGAIDRVKLGNLTAMLANFDSVVSSVKVAGPRSSQNHELVQAVAEANARRTAVDVLKGSQVLREMAEKKEIRVVAAMHDLKTGKVNFIN